MKKLRPELRELLESRWSLSVEAKPSDDSKRRFVTASAHYGDGSLEAIREKREPLQFQVIDYEVGAKRLEDHLADRAVLDREELENVKSFDSLESVAAVEGVLLELLGDLERMSDSTESEARF